MKPVIAQVWTFRSDSNPDKECETLRYTDATTSCNCPGWTRKVAADGSRSCKHTRAVDVGQADRLCSATHTYDPVNSPPKHAKTKSIETPKLGQRRITL